MSINLQPIISLGQWSTLLDELEDSRKFMATKKYLTFNSKTQSYSTKTKAEILKSNPKQDSITERKLSKKEIEDLFLKTLERTETYELPITLKADSEQIRTRAITEATDLSKKVLDIILHTNEKKLRNFAYFIVIASFVTIVTAPIIGLPLLIYLFSTSNYQDNLSNPINNKLKNLNCYNTFYPTNCYETLHINEKTEIGEEMKQSIHFVSEELCELQHLFPQSSRVHKTFTSIVYIGENSNKTIKINLSGNNDENLISTEFINGNKLDHPVINKTHRLFIISSKNNITKKAMEMDTVDGSIINIFYKKNKLDKETACKIIEQLKECCLYLFDQKFYWQDLNECNLLITKDGKAKLIDLEYWNIENNPHIRAFKLFIGAIEVLEWVAKPALRQGKTPDRDQEKLVLYPEQIFGENFSTLISSHPSISTIIHSQNASIESKCFKKDRIESIRDKIEKFSENELKNWLSDYFDHVKKNISK